MNEMDKPAEQKTALRAHFKEIRTSIPQEERWAADSEIMRRVCDLDAYKNAEAIFTYLSVNSEVETRGIIQQAWDDGKLVALPRTVPNSRDMEWYAVTSLEGLEEAIYGIWEPPENKEDLIDPCKTSHALAIVPGLSFDELGYRLGYGGGYYDIFLMDFLGISLGLCRDISLSPDPLRLEATDVSVDIVVTESDILSVAGLGNEHAD